MATSVVADGRSQTGAALPCADAVQAGEWVTVACQTARMPREAASSRTSKWAIDRAIFSLAWPALGALAIEPLVSIIDTAFVGRLGTTQLAALGVNTGLFGFAFFVFTAVAYATTPYVARAYGAGDHREAGAIAVQAMFLAAVVGTLGLVVLEGLAEPLVALMGATGDLAADAVGYLRIRALAMPGIMALTVGHGVFRGFQDTRTPLRVTLGVSLINLVLDPILIFGLDMGLNGAAWATAAAQLIGGVVMVRLLVSDRIPITITWKVPTWAEITPFLTAGSALTVRTLALVTTFTYATARATSIGVTAVAAHQVASQVWLFLALVVDAIAIAAQALVAKHLGEHDPDAARRVSDRMLRWGLLWGIGLGIVFWLLRTTLPTWFTDEAAVIAAAASLMPFVAVMQPLNALVFVWDGIFIGATRFRFLAIGMVGAALIGIALLSVATTITAVWWAIVALMGARVVPMAVAYRLGLS